MVITVNQWQAAKAHFEPVTQQNEGQKLIFFNKNINV